MARLNLNRVPLQEGTDDGATALSVDKRNAPILDIMGSQAVGPVLPPGSSFVGAGQVAQANEFVDPATSQVTPTAPAATVSQAPAPTLVTKPTTLTTPQVTSTAVDSAFGTMDAATQAAPTQTIAAPTGTVSAGAIPQAAVQDMDERATVQYQLSELYKTIESGKPLPAWAAGPARAASQVMQQRGLGSSSMAAAAIAQNVMEGAMPIAAADAQGYQRLQLTNLSNGIKTGDIIEVLTTNDNAKGPSRDWLNIVKTSRARSKIKQWYQRQMKDEDIQKGKQILNIWLDDNTDILNFANKDDILKNILNETSLPNYEMFYQKLGNGNLKIDNIANKIRKFVFPEEITDDEDIFTPEVKASENSELIIVEGYDDIKVRMAKCCVPVPGDDILGFVTISNGISVHRSDCMNIQIDSTKGERIIDVAWGFSTHTGNIIWLEIEAIDRPYLLRDATIAISDNGGNILVAKSVTSSKRIVSLVFQIEISDNTQLEEIIKDSKNIENVFEAARIFPGKK